MKQFMENKEGVHLMSPLESQYSMCGDAYDDVDEMKDTASKVVTCPRCVKIIEHCKRVKHNVNF